MKIRKPLLGQLSLSLVWETEQLFLREELKNVGFLPALQKGGRTIIDYLLLVIAVRTTKINVSQCVSVHWYLPIHIATGRRRAVFYFHVSII